MEYYSGICYGLAVFLTVWGWGAYCYRHNFDSKPTPELKPSFANYKHGQYLKEEAKPRSPRKPKVKKLLDWDLADEIWTRMDIELDTAERHFHTNYHEAYFGDMRHMMHRVFTHDAEKLAEILRALIKEGKL